MCLGGRLPVAALDSLTLAKRFWFRTRYISALAIRPSRLHPHVLQLHLGPSAVASFIASCTELLPGYLRACVRSALPEWFLPSQVVLKQEKQGEEKVIMEELFDTEVRAYRHLKPLQGIVIPTFYGSLRYNGTRALLLEYIGGTPMSMPEAATMSLEELSDLLQPCYRAIHALGVHHDDPNLSNFHLVDGRVMVLDLESADFTFSVNQRALYLMACVQHLASMYLKMQVFYRHEGALEAA